MKNCARLWIAELLALGGALLLSAAASASEFEVTVTNLTRGQQFTPILVASHRAGVHLFELGAPASPQLKTLAEEGNVAPLTALLVANPNVLDVVNSGALLNPGQSVTQRVSVVGNFDSVSVAACSQDSADPLPHDHAPGRP